MTVTSASIRGWILGYALIAAAVSGTAWGAQTYTGKVRSLADGDTFQFQADGEKKVFKVRMLAIDTAETHFGVPGGTASQGFWGEQGAAHLAKLIAPGDAATLEVYGEDNYGRKLGRLLKKGVDINLEMLRSGWASLYMICETGTVCKTGELPAAELKNYRAACNEAVKQGRGLFDPARPVPMLPFVFRAHEGQRALARFPGDLSKNAYHPNPNDYEKVHVCDRLFFNTEVDAVQNGFKPVR